MDDSASKLESALTALCPPQEGLPAEKHGGDAHKAAAGTSEEKSVEQLVDQWKQACTLWLDEAHERLAHGFKQVWCCCCCCCCRQIGDRMSTLHCFASGITGLAVAEASLC